MKVSNTKKNDRELRIGIDYSFPGLDFTPALTLDAPLVQAAELRVHGLLGPHVEPLDEADLRALGAAAAREREVAGWAGPSFWFVGRISDW